LNFSTQEACRKQARQWYQKQSSEELGKLSKKINDIIRVDLFPWMLQLLSSIEPGRKSTLGFFKALPLELDLTASFEHWLTLGHKAAFPKVEPEGGLTFRSYPDSVIGRARWMTGSFGVEEPPPEWPAIKNAAELDFIFVPGLAFSNGGQRVGRGGGYFDRFLAGNKRSVRIGVAPDDLIFDQLPQNPWDQRVDIMVSERGSWDVGTLAPLKSGVAPANRFR
jgi:5-formyltetrahydrofolate cyclo-ligase